jgi:hypothetical protein
VRRSRQRDPCLPSVPGSQSCCWPLRPIRTQRRQRRASHFCTERPRIILVVDRFPGVVVGNGVLYSNNDHFGHSCGSWSDRASDRVQPYQRQPLESTRRRERTHNGTYGRLARWVVVLCVKCCEGGA